MDIPFLVYGILIFLSIFISILKYPRWETAHIVFWGKRIIFFVFNCVAVFYISFLMAKDKFFRRILIYALLLTATVAAIYAFLQYTGHEFIWPRNLHHYGSRSVSTFGNPNFLSSFLIVVLMLSIYLYFDSSGLKAAFYLLIFLLNFFALLITETRSSWGGFAAALFLFLIFFLRRGTLRKAAVSIVLAVIVAAIFPHLAYNRDHPSVFSRITNLTKVKKLEKSNSLQQRLMIWECALRMFKKSPVIGHGWGSFELRYPFEQGVVLRRKPEWAGMRTHANNSHNEILEELSQIGIVGFLAFCFLWFVFLKNTISSFLRDKSMLLAAVLAASLGFFADNLLNVTFNFPMPALAFWVSAGIASAASQKKSFKFFKPVGYSRIYLGLSIAVFFIFLFGQIRYFKGEIHYFKGFTLSRRGMLEDATAECLKSWQYYKYNVDNNYELGNCYMRRGRFKKAIWAYKEALRANYGYDEIYFNLSIAEQSAGMLAESEKNLLEAIRINPVSAEYYMSAGNFYLKNRKDQNKAREYYEKALSVKPDSVDTLNNLGYLYLLEGKMEKSLEYYKKALEVNPAYEIAEKNIKTVLKGMKIPIEKWRASARNLVKRKKFAEAAAIYRKITDYNPGDVLSLFYLANCYTSVKQFSDAVKIYQKLVKFFPKELNFVLNLAKIYIYNGESEKAISLLQKAKRRFPKSGEIDSLLKDLNGR